MTTQTTIFIPAGESRKKNIFFYESDNNKEQNVSWIEVVWNESIKRLWARVNFVSSLAFKPTSDGDVTCVYVERESGFIN